MIFTWTDTSEQAPRQPHQHQQGCCGKHHPATGHGCLPGDASPTGRAQQPCRRDGGGLGSHQPSEHRLDHLGGQLTPDQVAVPVDPVLGRS
jgi:hypothetical protein